ncbi:MAG: hypothetical protein FJ222_11230 [Lentisphaerae bacterium]|nr:hypothetical protein [Lentisphaerota bacterium]
MKQPNVVFIISDDTKHKWLSSYQGKPECQPLPELRVPTPNIDRIASRGTRFDNAFCASATCQPSRYSYLTGRYAGSNPHPRFLSRYPRTRPASVEFNVYLNEDIPSQGFLFGQAGYRTGFAGKWHASTLGPEDRLPEIDPDEKPDAPGMDQKLRAHQQVLSENIKRTAGYDYAEGIVWCNNSPEPLKALDTHHIEWSIQKALDFLDTCSGDRPFVLHYASTCVHGPSALAAFEKDPRFTLGGKVDTVCDALPPRTGIVERLQTAGCKVNHQTASALWLDDQIGAILNKLEAMGVIDNTILVFCTDHGVEPGKTTCYERGINVPCFIAAPGMKKGHISRMMVQNIDMLPTLLDLCGITHKLALDGTSLAPILRGEERELHNDLFFEYGYFRAVRTPEFKYITLRYPEHVVDKMKRKDPDAAPNQTDRFQGNAQVALSYYKDFFAPEQLFDLRNDPYEDHNLADDPAYATTLRDMQTRLDRYLDAQPHPYPRQVPAFMRTQEYLDFVKTRVDAGTGMISWWHLSALKEVL